MLNTKHKIALANLVQIAVMGVRRLFGKGPEARVRRNGIEWKLDLREGIDFSIWLLGSFEPQTVHCYQRIVKEGDTVLDIGANIGAHTLLLARSVGSSGNVIAFEPTDYAFSKLLGNCALNPQLLPRIHPEQMMLVSPQTQDQPTPALYSSWPLKSEDGLHAFHQGRLMSTAGASGRTLDSVVSLMGLDRVDFIKLDIDGHECEMLKGASQTLSRWHPTIIMELAPVVLQECGTSIDELMAILRGHGYRFHSLRTDCKLPEQAEALKQSIPRGGSINVVAKCEEY